MLLDFSALKGELRAVLEGLDHSLLNDEAAFQDDPSAERIAEFVFKALALRLPLAPLHAVEVFETEQRRRRATGGSRRQPSAVGSCRRNREDHAKLRNLTEAERAAAGSSSDSHSRMLALDPRLSLIEKVPPVTGPEYGPVSGPEPASRPDSSASTRILFLAPRAEGLRRREAPARSSTKLTLDLDSQVLRALSASPARAAGNSTRTPTVSMAGRVASGANPAAETARSILPESGPLRRK